MSTETILPPPVTPSVSTSTVPPSANRSRGIIAIAMLLLGAIAGVMGGHLWPSGDKPSTVATSMKSESPPEGEILLTPEQCEIADIRMEPVMSVPLTDYVWRSGIVQFNQDRVAHIACPVDGVLRNVLVQQGQTVAANDVLCIVDSRQVGRAKLDLMAARLALSAAETQNEWIHRTTANAKELWTMLDQRKSVNEIEVALRGKPTGEWRDKLLKSYSRAIQLRGTVNDLMQAGPGVVPESTLRKARAEAEAAGAEYDAVFEEARYQMDFQVRTAEQKLKEAKAAVDTARAELLMIGYSLAEVDSLDPASEGETVSYFPVRAPFAGTIVNKHAVQGERITAEHMLFVIADLQEMWIKADLFEPDFVLTRKLGTEPLRFRFADSTSQSYEARLHYIASSIDADTRSLPVLATAKNTGQNLKAGLFVEVGFPRSTTEPVISVPSAAILQHEGQQFVFVQKEPGKFVRTNVKTGRVIGTRTEILAGLKVGEPVVISGTFVLKTEMLKSQIGEE